MQISHMRIFHAQHDKIKCQFWTINPDLTKYQSGEKYAGVTEYQINTPA